MTLSRIGSAALSLLLMLTVAACGEKSQPVDTANAERAHPATPVLPDGTPQIVTAADGVHIQYRQYGAGDPAVILVHCWSCDSSYWNAQIGPLKAHYTTVTVDLAGHGGSGRNRTEWSIGNFGEDVAAVARQLTNSRIVLVGHSMGAPVALEAARRIGDRVIGIIAVDSLKTIGQPPISEREITMRLKPFRENFIGQTRDFVSANLFTKDADPAFVRKVAEDMSLAPPEVAIPAMEALVRMDYAKVLPDIHIPVIAINSDHGGATDEMRIRKSLPTFSAIVISNAGHFLMMETPGRFNPILLGQIDKLAGTR
jgi:pimeloyl-ACP methyl ester carboxylesterase